MHATFRFDGGAFLADTNICRSTQKQFCTRFGRTVPVTAYSDSDKKPSLDSLLFIPKADFSGRCVPVLQEFPRSSSTMPLQSQRQLRCLISGDECCKIERPGERKPNQKNLYRRPEVCTVDDTQPEIELQPKSESEPTASESNRAELAIPAASVGEVTVAAVVSTNGPSLRKIAANRKNAQKSTGPKTDLGKTMSSRTSTRHVLLSMTLPVLPGRSKKQFTRLLHSLMEDFEPWARWRNFWLRRLLKNIGVSVWSRSMKRKASHGRIHFGLHRLTEFCAIRLRSIANFSRP